MTSPFTGTDELYGYGARWRSENVSARPAAPAHQRRVARSPDPFLDREGSFELEPLYNFLFHVLKINNFMPTKYELSDEFVAD